MYAPGGHTSGAVPPGQKDPSGQGAHTVALSYEPVPGGQGEHAPSGVPVGEKKPLVHVDGIPTPGRHDDCCASEEDPAGHALHASEPAAATRPGVHGTHVDELVAAFSLLAVPAGHGVQLAEPSNSEKEPGGQGMQSLALRPPIWPRNVPAAQN